MKADLRSRCFGGILCAMFGLLLTTAAWGQTAAPAAPAAVDNAAEAQDAPAVPAQPGAMPAAPAASGAPAAPAPAAADADKVALNLKQANIDQVMKFLTDLTGKPVMKHKDAKAQITIVSNEKVSKQDAVRMICEALRLDGVSLVERNTIIWLVPEAMLPQLDVALTLPAGAVPQVGVVSKALSVKFADVAELEKIIRPLLGKNAVLTVHPTSRKIIITDTVDRIQNVENVLAELDALDVDNRQVQIFQLEHADAEEIAPLIRAVMSPAKGGSSSGAAQPPPPGGSGTSPSGARSIASDVEVQPYKGANWLLVVSPREKLAKVAQLVSEMDQELTQEVRLRIIPVKYASAEDLARQLGPLAQKRYGTKKVRETLEIAADSRSNSLVVLSSEQNYQAMQSLVKELDTQESVQTKTEWFELKYADAEDLAEQMNNLYQGMEEERPWWYWGGPSRKSEAKTRFVFEKRSNSLIAIAAPVEFERIRDVVKRLDVSIENDQVSPRIFSIRNSDAKEMADVLNRVFGVEDTSRQGGYYDYLISRSSKKSKIGRLYGQVRFDPLISSNSIIVTTNNKENFPIVASFIGQMDGDLPESSNLLVVTLKNAQAETLARQLNALFGREGTRVPDKKDQSQQEQQEQQNYSFLYGPQPKKDDRPISDLIGRVRVVADTRTNSLLITTPVQNHASLKALVEKLDVDSPKVHVAVRLIEVNRTKSDHIGVRFSSMPSIFESADFDNGVQSTLGYAWQAVHKDGVLSANVSISALVQFMIQNFDSRILSDTTLTMDNNRPGRIFVGSQIPFIKNSQAVEGTVNSTYEYKDAGTELKLTPIINLDNRVVMDIEMTASQARPGDIILGGQVLDTRNFKTMLAVENNQTIVMGGILSEQSVKNIRRTPILGYIPVLDWVFAKKDTEHQVTELIAFITPVVLRSAADDEAVTREAEEGVRGRLNWPAQPDDAPRSKPSGKKGADRVGR